MPETARTRRRRRRQASDAGGPAAELRVSPALAIWRGLGVVAFRFVLPVVLLLTVAVGIAYVRLLNGPVSLPFLSEPIARGINSELSDFKVSIGEAIVELRGNSFEFRLKDVRMDDLGGQAVAVAPLASVEVSRRAFFRGQISPSRIVLIEPQLRAFYNAESGLALSIDNKTGIARKDAEARPGQSKATVPPARSPSSSANSPGAGRIDLARTIALLAERARERSNTTSYLERVGVRNASLLINQGGARTVWQIPNAEFDLSRFSARSKLTGRVTIASARGNWQVELRAEEAHKSETVQLSTTIRDLAPETLAEVIPGLSSLTSLKFPVSGKADLVLSPKGEVLSGDFEIGLGRGRIALPGLAEMSPGIDTGLVRLRFSRGQNSLQVLPSKLRWAGSRITVAGSLTPRPTNKDTWAWDFSLRSSDGRLSTGRTGTFIKLEEWLADGTVFPTEGIVNFDSVVAKAGDGEVALKGIVYAGPSPGLSVSGRLGPMLSANFFGFWPTYIAPKARLWAKRNLRSGQVAGGTFAFKLIRADNATSSDDPPRSEFGQSLKIDLSNVRFLVDEALPAVFAERATINLKDETLDVSVPEAAFVVGDDRSLNITDMRMVAADIFDPAVDGETVFRVKGDISDGLEIAARLGVIDLAVATDLAKRANARLDGRFNLTVPIDRPDALPPVTVAGQLRILDGAVPKIWRNFDVRGSKVVIDIDRNDFSAKGQLLLAGIPVALQWQGFVDAPQGRQPPVRLSATLDQADRKQLGLQVNHLVQGPMDVDVTLKVNGKSEQPDSAHVRIDLTKSDVSIESLAWRKPIGRRANVEFDVVSVPGGEARLDNIRVDGQNIAVRGEGSLGPDGQLQSFDLPEFSIDVVTRLKVKGERQKGNVWRVSARGPTYEGRELFRTLFSAGRLKGRPAPKSQAGLDLDVRIGNVLGFWQTGLRDVRLDLSKRNGKIVSLDAKGKLQNDKTLTATASRESGRRRLRARSDDAGQTLQLVGFYPNIRGGNLDLVVDLDGRGDAERVGRLSVRRFKILGDPILSEVVQSRPNKSRRRQRRKQDVVRQVLNFDWMRLPFEVGRGEFLVTDAELRGPVHGVLLCGRANFDKRGLKLVGTYVPLQGISSVVGVIPGLGQLLAGPKGAGVFGVNFQIKGAMEQPQVLVNPLSLATPGIFREVLKESCPKSTALKTKGGRSKSGSRQRDNQYDWTKDPFSN